MTAVCQGPSMKSSWLFGKGERPKLGIAAPRGFEYPCWNSVVCVCVCVCTHTYAHTCSSVKRTEWKGLSALFLWDMTPYSNKGFY